MCAAFVTPILRQKLTPELLVDTAQVQANVVDNHILLTQFSERLCSALFATKNETSRLKERLATLFRILASTRIVPTLAELYPFDFIVKEGDAVAPTQAYSRFIANITARISSLRLTPENEHIVRRTFFLEFIDRLDRACEFQKMIKIDKVQFRFEQYCQSQAQLVADLSAQRVMILDRAAKTFRWIKCGHSISYNLNIVLSALPPLMIFRQAGVALAIAMSGNLEVSAFVEFIQKHLSDDQIARVILTQYEREHIAKLVDAAHTLIQDEAPGLTLLISRGE
jgi:hypothetical protein